MKDRFKLEIVFESEEKLEEFKESLYMDLKQGVNSGIVKIEVENE